MAESDKQAERAQKVAKPQKAQKTNAKAGANKAKAKQEEEALLRADTFTNAPKVSRRTLTKEEREAIAKQREAETREAEKIAMPHVTLSGGLACNPDQIRSRGAWRSWPLA